MKKDLINPNTPRTIIQTLSCDRNMIIPALASSRIKFKNSIKNPFTFNPLNENSFVSIMKIGLRFNSVLKFT
ncbi:MAG: hypothetical protein ACD_77C00336G0001 [uncultured bacterium]|nr:MAG: hypothetical protein ACD_77C00336G0001 [uncultured bacterium]